MRSSIARVLRLAAITAAVLAGAVLLAAQNDSRIAAGPYQHAVVRAALPAQPAATQAATPAPAVKPALPEALTEVEQLKLENLTLKASMLAQQQQQLQQQYSALVAEIQLAHPGYALSPSGALVPAAKSAHK